MTNTLRLRDYLLTLLASLETATVTESRDRTRCHDCVSWEITLPGHDGVVFTVERDKTLSREVVLGRGRK